MNILHLFLLLVIEFRAVDIVVTVSANLGSIFDTVENRCGFVLGTPSVTTDMHCPRPITGRYVQLQNSLTVSQTFHLREVEVYGAIIQ